MRAGARGVWANRGVIDAGTANQHVELFMKALGEGSSVYDAIRKVEQQESTANAAAGLFALLLKQPNSAATGE